MRKLAALLLVAFLTPSCTFLRDEVCGVGLDTVKTTTADVLGFIPILGPMAGSITNLAFEIVCKAVALPADLGDQFTGETGLQLDPTAGSNGASPSTASSDSGS